LREAKKRFEAVRGKGLKAALELSKRMKRG